MKKLLLFVSFLIIAAGLVQAQVPSAFNYQAVVRDNSGAIVANQNVSFRISITNDLESVDPKYMETHTATTNAFGLVTLKIGTGEPVGGFFTPGGWGDSPHYLRVELDAQGGNSYTLLSTSQLLAVPYAFHAQTVEEDQVDDADADATNELQTISLAGHDLTISDGNTITLPSSESPWLTDGNNVYRLGGTVGIGSNPGSDSKFKLYVNGGNQVAISAQNDSDTHGALYASNSGNGPAAIFGKPLKIIDGSQGEGKVLTSDADGMTSWKSIAASPWNAISSDRMYTNSQVGIGTNNPYYNLDIFSDDYTHFGLRSEKSVFQYMLAGESNNVAITIYGKNEDSNMFSVGLSADQTFRISSVSNTLQGLEVSEEGDVKVSNEIHTAATGGANMIPIAYATVLKDGGHVRTSNNVVTEKISTGFYEIAIDGVEIENYAYILSVSLVGSDDSEAIAAKWAVGNSGKFRIYIVDAANNRVDSHFSVVIYKP